MTGRSSYLVWFPPAQWPGRYPTREAYQQQLHDLPGITIIDLSALRSGDRVNHNVYATSPDVVRLIGDRLIQGQIVTDWDVSSPAAATDTVGSAVGLAVAAPIIILF